MNVDAVEPIITVELSLSEATEFVKKNVSSATYIPDISLLMATEIRKKLEELKKKME